MSAEIDWANAPKWADRVVIGCMSGALYWADFFQRQKISSNEYFGDTIHICEVWEVKEWRRSAIWSGDGLPPIGLACEALVDPSGKYTDVLVIAHDECEAVFRFTSGHKKGQYLAGEQKQVCGFWAFRPIRTEEQLHEEKRMTDAKALFEQINPASKWHKADHELWLEAIDAGWQKVQP